MQEQTMRSTGPPRRGRDATSAPLWKADVELSKRMGPSDTGGYVYCDHNFLITLRDAGQQYGECVQKAVATGQVRFVLSLWSLVEVARARDELEMVTLAAVIDGLRPGWLPERERLQRHEVADRFFQYLRVPYDRPNPVRTLGEVAAEFCGIAVPVDRHYSAVQFARLLREDVGPIEDVFEEAAKARQTNARAWKQGWIKANGRLGLAEYVARLLPSRTPGGIEVGESTRRDFLKELSLEHLPSVAVEYAIFEEGLDTGSKLSAQSFLDVQHGVMLPYVTALVSDDVRFTRVVKRVVRWLPFPLGRMITREAFDREFLGNWEQPE